MWRSFLEMWRRGLQGTWRYHSSLSIRLTPTAVVGKSRLYPSIELEGARFEIGLATKSSMVVRDPPKDLCEHSDVQHCRALISVCQDFLNCSGVAILHQCNRCVPASAMSSGCLQIASPAKKERLDPLGEEYVHWTSTVHLQLWEVVVWMSANAARA